MSLYTLKDFDFKGKRVLVRLAINVPLKNKSVVDDIRLKLSVPTLNYILKQSPKQLIIMGHIGRPHGKIVEELKVDRVAKKISKLLGKQVKKTKDCITRLPDGQIVMLENLRFHIEEEKNNEGFGKKLASYADLYVNESFDNAHHVHASSVVVPKYLPGCVGFLFEKEITFLSKLHDPEQPYVAIVGGEKMEKIKIIEKILKKATKVLVGGVLANTFLVASGMNIKASIYDKENLGLAKKLLKKFKGKIILPIDAVVGDKFNHKAKAKTVDIDKVPDNWLIFDIGPKTIKFYKKELSNAKTISWNGPIGVFEFKQFSKGTEEIAKELSKSKATTIIGGGESAEAIKKFGLTNKMTYVSTGGGASLEFLGGKKLPAIQALEDNYKKFKI